MHKWLWWLPAIAVMIIIFCFSAQEAEVSSDVSRGVTREIVDTLPVTRNYEEPEKVKFVRKMNNYVRKAAHVTLYALLAICAVFGLNLLIRNKWLMFAIAIGVCFLYACSDEMHQLFVDGRGAQWSDVFLDTGGAVIGVFLYDLIKGIFRRGA